MQNISRRSLLAGGTCALASVPAKGWAATGLLVPQPGSRHTWAGGSATIPGVPTQIEPDNNGNWINMATGQRYQEFDTPGGAGLGYVVTDITHSTAKGFAGQSVNLSCPDGFSGPSAIIQVKTFLGDLADSWMDPRQLAALGEGTSANIRSARVTYALDNSNFNALRIQTRESSGWTQNIYDLESGILLSHGSTSKGRPVTTLNGQNNFQSGEGSTSIAFSRLSEARMTTLPGLNEEFPQNLRGLRSLQYQGQSVSKVAGFEDYVLPSNIFYAILQNAGPYLEARVSTNGAANPETSIHTAGPIGTLWMNPQTLRRYTQPSTLDSDPLTGVTVNAIGTWGSTVAFSVETRLTRNAFAYDANNGLLMQSEFTDASKAATFVNTYRFAGAQ